MSFTLTTSAAIIMKCGENADTSASASGALLKEYCDQAEGTLCADTRYDWVANYSSIGTNFKPILANAVSSLAAALVINYNLSSFFSRSEALSMQNVLYTQYKECVVSLEDAAVRRAMGAT